jgi:Ca2+-dependent lipid-binding protein
VGSDGPNASGSGPGQFELTVMHGRHLPKMDKFGKADPFCEIRFGGDERKTAVRKNTYSPDWNEAFVFSMDDVSKRPSSLSISVLDSDRLDRLALIGKVEISADEVWSALRTYDQPVEKEWPLTDADKFVIGHDKQTACITVRLRSMNGVFGLKAINGVPCYGIVQGRLQQLDMSQQEDGFALWMCRRFMERCASTLEVLDIRSVRCLILLLHFLASYLFPCI